VFRKVSYDGPGFIPSDMGYAAAGGQGYTWILMHRCWSEKEAVGVLGQVMRLLGRLPGLASILDVKISI
jgi:hypothetical protein